MQLIALLLQQPSSILSLNKQIELKTGEGAFWLFHFKSPSR